MVKPRSSGPLTSRDVARLLGVSQSMVSRAFDPRASVTPEKRRFIVDAAARLGYRPNVIARSLSTNSSRMVGIIVGSVENPFYALVLERLSRALQQVGYQSLFFSIPAGGEADDQLPFLLQYNVDAIVVAAATLSSGLAREWSRLGRKAALINRTVADVAVGSVSCDNEAGGRMIADHLLDRGYRRIAFVAGRPDTSTNRDRERGFLARLAERRQPLHARADGGDYTFAAGHEAALRLAPQRPDAIFFANDVLALGGMDALRHQIGLRIPEDVAVVGFDDIPMASWPSYALTTVSQPIDGMVSETVALILPDAASPRRIALPGTLIERRSTRGGR